MTRRYFSYSTHNKIRKLNKCMVCGRDGEKYPLEIHHIFPVRAGGTNKIDNLVLLCRLCHKKANKYGNEEKLHNCRERLLYRKKRKSPKERHLENTRRGK